MKTIHSTIVSTAISRLSALAISALAYTGMGIALAQTIIVADPNGTNGLRSYSISGVPINASLVPGTGFQGLALEGSNLYIADMTSNAPMIRRSTLNGTGGIATNGFFTIGGTPNGLTSPFGLALTSTDLYIANFNSGNVFRYNLASGLQTATLSLNNINGGYNPNPYGLAIKDDTLWVSQATTGNGASTIKGFSLSNFNGVATHTISSVTLPLGLTVAGNILYVVNSPSSAGASGSVETFDATTGTAIATLVSGLTKPQGLTVYENKLFVTGGDGTVKGFDATTGAVLAGFTTITGLSSPYGIVVTPQSVGTLTIGMYAGLTVTGTVGAPYTIEYTTSLTPPIVWTPLSTGTLMTSPFLYIDTSIIAGSRFYRATF